MVKVFNYGAPCEDFHACRERFRPRNLFRDLLHDWTHPHCGVTAIEWQPYRNVWFTLWGPRCAMPGCWRNHHWDGLCVKHINEEWDNEL